MTRAPLKFVRLLVETTILLLFVLGFFLARPRTDALAGFLARAQFVPSFITLVLAGGGAAGIAVVAVIALTGVFGRIYCSSLCPLGAVQDGILRVRRLLTRRYRYLPSRLPIARAIAGLGFVLIVLGIPLVIHLFGPYRFFGMLMKDLAYPVIALGSHVAYFILRPFGVFVSPLVVPVDGVLLFIALAAASILIVMTARRGRLYCNTLCPVGGVLSVPASRSVLAIRIDADRCTRCGACEAVCKAGCIESGVPRVDAARCISCFNCLSTCPVDALSYSIARKAGKPATESKGVSRRHFLSSIRSLGTMSLSLFPISFLLRRRSRAPDGSSNTPASPPGSRSVERFSSLCIACHLCVTRCPTGVLAPSLLEYGLGGVMQPTMDYRHGFCEYECNTCSHVCPTGAILPIALDDKKVTQIGRVEFLRARCVVVTNGTACGACAEVCPTHAVHMVPHEGILTIPETDVDVCVGCGNCEFACPVTPAKAIYVRGNAVHKRRVAMSEEHTIQTIEPEGEQEFPF